MTKQQTPCKTAVVLFFLMAAGIASSSLLAAEKQAQKNVPDMQRDIGTQPKSDNDASADPKQVGLTIWFIAGAGVVSEDGLNSDGSARAGGKVRYLLRHGLSIGATYRALWYDQQYISNNPAPDGLGNQRITDSETFQDVQLVLAFNPLFTITKIVLLNIELAPRYVDLRNTSFSASSGSVRLGLDATYMASQALYLFGRGGWSMGFLGAEAKLSLMGKPKTFWDAGAGFGYRFSDDNGSAVWSTEFGWQGDWVVFERTVRNYQAATVSLGIGF